MNIRRLTRLTNAYSNKIESHRAAIASHFAYYNFCLIHGSLESDSGDGSRNYRSCWKVSELLV